MRILLRRVLRLVLAVSLAAAAAVAALKPAFVLWALQLVQPGVTWEFPDAGNRIALTFDDGPDPVYTPQVLSILKQENVPPTFFLIGGQARRYPALVSEIRAAGHEIGNHTMSWRATFSMPGEDLLASLKETEQILQLEPAAPKWFRPANGWIRNEQVVAARSLGYTTVLGSSFAFDQFQPPPALISMVISHSLRPGGIIVLHDGGGPSRANSVAALPAIIRDARRRGLQFVRLSELETPPEQRILTGNKAVSKT